MSKINMELENITPKKARELLEGNTQNRKPRKRLVSQYARDMKHGLWNQQGDPIRINGDNTLLDGQHRLMAIVESGVAQRMIIVRGIDKRAMLAMDTGAKRSFGDVLKMLGHKNVNHLAATVKFCVLNECPDREPYRGNATFAEMRQWLEANPSIVDHVDRIVARSSKVSLKLRTPLMAISFYATDPADFRAFFERCSLGANLDQHSPEFALRRMVDNIEVTRTPPINRAACTIKAWNAYMLGNEVKLLVFKNGGVNREAFPKIITTGEIDMLEPTGKRELVHA